MSNNNNNHIIQDDQQLLSNNDSDFSLYSATTNAECCCGNESCENHHVWMQIIRKLENDARLAAAIGQSLLQQHEKYTMDTDQSKIVMEQQLDGYREQIHKLEQSLDASDTAKQELDDEKNKCKWINLSGTLREKEAEVERLQTFEKMTKQANVREDSLRSKLEDAQQEIETYQRKEKVSDARYKKMKEKHGKLLL
ncbi:hypothetical protein BDA99DRAFT_432039 [Phascolomyces articulosus]|uniref:Uncharacterized protein n=1 Tax=Phascolomyces articulosus TaxID=60185 RepID=A0AAD5KRR2_9FUNG|nr:hypothetical protein BDA99DRAFT_432039 [Phascolomyces articulosus]